MKIYSVETPAGEYKTFYTLTEAKKFMKANPGSTGSITKVYSNGDWVNCGAIELKGSNKTFVANTRQTTKSYN